MTRTLLSLMTSFALAGSLVAAQGSPGSQQPAQPGPQQPAAPGQRDPSPAPAPSPSSPGAQSAQQKAPEVTLTGCLVQGSTPSTFILENARTATDSATSKGKSYIITAVAGTDLKQHLNHQIRVTGSEASASSGSSSGSSMSGSSAPGAPGSRPDASAPASPGSSSSSGSPSGSSVSGSQSAAQSASRQDDDERDMTRFTARTVTMVASTCSAA